jgi:hypothetical protein
MKRRYGSYEVALQSGCSLPADVEVDKLNLMNGFCEDSEDDELSDSWEIRLDRVTDALRQFQ